MNRDPKFIRKPNRLPLENYRGCCFGFVTSCCYDRLKAFINGEEAKRNLVVLKDLAQQYQITLWAYCFMPDHVHFLLEGLSEESNILTFMERYKQKTGFSYKQRTGQILWQKSFYDHILRKDEAIESVVWYIITNPVRSGIVNDFQVYPYIGSWIIDIKPLEQPLTPEFIPPYKQT
ncbi:MAG: REP-associated tyrosine transposase [Candidatus Poribacteria bacterium]|nr:REP-associated tyrosine transposase [Candidatus Poribacteria bacterium]